MRQQLQGKSVQLPYQIYVKKVCAICLAGNMDVNNCGKGTSHLQERLGSKI